MITELLKCITFSTIYINTHTEIDYYSISTSNCTCKNLTNMALICCSLALMEASRSSYSITANLSSDALVYTKNTF